MKTFEERYTEWIDGELRGATLIAFEEELARRAQAGEAQAEKVGAASLRALLREHLQAPELSNAEFFHHQLRERIEREGSAQRRLAPERAPAGAPWWSFARFRFILPAGAAAAFVAVALYYASMPGQPSRAPALAALTHRAPSLAAAPAPTPEPLAPRSAGGPVEMALNDVPATPDLEAQTLDLSTSVTALKYKGANKDQNVQVLWMNGLEYQPDVPSPAPAAAAP